MKNTLTSMSDMCHHLAMTYDTDEEFVSKCLEHLYFLDTPTTVGNLKAYFKDTKTLKNGAEAILFWNSESDNYINIRNVNEDGYVIRFAQFDTTKSTFDDLIKFDLEPLPEEIALDDFTSNGDKALPNFEEFKKLVDSIIGANITDDMDEGSHTNLDESSFESESLEALKRYLNCDAEDIEEAYETYLDEIDELHNELLSGLADSEEEEEEDYGILSCDNKNCDEEIEVPFWLLNLFVDVPCSKCGENLLTQEDFIKFTTAETTAENTSGKAVSESYANKVEEMRACTSTDDKCCGDLDKCTTENNMCELRLNPEAIQTSLDSFFNQVKSGGCSIGVDATTDCTALHVYYRTKDGAVIKVM